MHSRAKPGSAALEHSSSEMLTLGDVLAADAAGFMAALRRDRDEMQDAEHVAALQRSVGRASCVELQAMARRARLLQRKPPPGLSRAARQVEIGRCGLVLALVEDELASRARVGGPHD